MKGEEEAEEKTSKQQTHTGVHLMTNALAKAAVYQIKGSDTEGQAPFQLDVVGPSRRPTWLKKWMQFSG